MKSESYYQLENELNKYNLHRILSEITEICRTEILDKPRTTEKAQDLILYCWNNKQEKADIKEHRISYFLLYHLRLEYKAKLRIREVE